MSKVAGSTMRRVAAAVGGYLALTIAAALLYPQLRDSVSRGSAPQQVYALCGPALALYTHMSYPLFALLSVLVFPWLLLALYQSSARWPAMALFAIAWLSVGWYMYDLF